MDTVYPVAASALARGRRLRRGGRRQRTRTMPVTFAEIKEVDEECEGQTQPVAAGASDERRRRDELVTDTADDGAAEAAPAGLQLAACAPPAHQRRHRARRDVILEPPDEPPAPCARAASEPRVHVDQ